MEEEAHPRQVVIEVEQVEIDAAHARQPHEDELARHVAQGSVQTGNLPVEQAAIGSVLAAEDDEDRPIGLTSEPLRLFEIAQPERARISGGREAGHGERQAGKTRHGGFPGCRRGGRGLL